MPLAGTETEVTEGISRTSILIDPKETEVPPPEPEFPRSFAEILKVAALSPVDPVALVY